MNEWVITTAITLGIGAITYFLKRTMLQVDKVVSELQEVKRGGAEKSELKETADGLKSEMKEETEELKTEIKQIREDYTPRRIHEKAFDECRKDIKDIRANYLTRDDFIREINKMDRKLDQILTSVLNGKGGIS